MAEEIKLPQLNNNQNAGIISRPSSKQSQKSQQQQQALIEGKNSKQSIDNITPFKLPTDAEVFLYCENEKQKKEEHKRSLQTLKIWDKKTASNRNSLKHFKSYQAPMDQKHVTKTAYKTQEKKLIQAALDIAKQREVKNELDQKKETIVEVLEQKKEMFLVTMSYGIIEDEIEKIKKISEDKQLAMETSERMLKLDHENFQNYLNSNKQQKVEAELQADKVAKLKKEKEGEIKNLNIRITSLRAEKTRNQESVDNYLEHKDFLDKLASKDWQEEKQKKLKQIIEEVKEKWIQKKIQKYQQQEEKNLKGKQKKTMAQIKKELQDLYFEKLKNDKIREIEEFEDDYPIYFKHPSELVKHFDDLEQKNVDLIQNKQDFEQNYEELKNKFNKESNFLENKANGLSNQISGLKRQIEEVDNKIKELRIKSEECKTNIKKDNNTLKLKIYALYDVFKDEIALHDVEFKDVKDTLNILSAIEGQLEKQLKQLKEFKIKDVEFFRKDADKKRTQDQRKLQQKKNDKEQEQRDLRNLSKMMQPSIKKEGRIDMKRSAPFEKKINQQVVVTNDEEEEDKKHFKDYYLLI